MVMKFLIRYWFIALLLGFIVFWSVGGLGGFRGSPIDNLLSHQSQADVFCISLGKTWSQNFIGGELQILEGSRSSGGNLANIHLLCYLPNGRYVQYSQFIPMNSFHSMSYWDHISEGGAVLD